MHFSLSSEFLAFFQKDSQLSSTWTTVYSMLIVQNVKKSVFFLKEKKKLVILVVFHQAYAIGTSLRTQER